MKKIFVIVLILTMNLIYTQNYFEGKRLYCRSKNTEAMELFRTGIKALHLNSTLNVKLLKVTSEVFYSAYKIDTTFCDALFFTGYTLRLLEDKNALTCYYLADSLANNASVEFKTNLAAEALRFGNEASVKLARKKYNEIIKYFPESPEGYYGFALTSPIYEDVEQGLQYINVAIGKYNLQNIELKDDVIFIKGILLALNKKYEEGLENLESCYSTYKKDETFKIHYSLCLLKVSEIKNDKKLKQKAVKIYEKIEHKDQIPDNVKSLLIF